MPRDFEGKDTNLHTEDLQDWEKGDILLAAKLQQAITFLKNAFASVRPGRQLRLRAGGNFFAKRFAVVRAEADFVIGRAAEDPNDTDEIVIAYPPEFRKQIYDFETTKATSTANPKVGYTRTLPNDRVNKYKFLNVQKRKAIAQTDEADEADEDTEVQVIVPAYVTGDIIFAMHGIQGGTGLTQRIDEENIAITWQEMNISGRAWAKADDQDDED